MFKIDYQKIGNRVDGFFKIIESISEPTHQEKTRQESIDKAINEGRVNIHYHSGCLGLILCILFVAAAFYGATRFIIPYINC